MNSGGALEHAGRLMFSKSQLWKIAAAALLVPSAVTRLQSLLPHYQRKSKRRKILHLYPEQPYAKQA